MKQFNLHLVHSIRTHLNVYACSAHEVYISTESSNIIISTWGHTYTWEGPILTKIERLRNTLHSSLVHISVEETLSLVSSALHEHLF